MKEPIIKSAENSKKDNQDLEDAKTCNIFNKLRLNKQIRETNKNNEEIITKKCLIKKYQ